MNKCYDCIYRGNVSGDAHSCCRYPKNETGMFDLFSAQNMKNSRKLNIKGDPHGVRMGWFMWPTNFDPTWLINCDGFKAKEN